MDIVVLCGGLSAERDVSLSTGALSAAALRRKGNRAAVVDLFLGLPDTPDLSAQFTLENTTAIPTITTSAPSLESLRASRSGIGRIGANVLEICKLADIVFLAVHGEDGEDGKIQAVFDLLEIKYTGTGVLGSTLAMNKSIAKVILRDNSIKTPDSILLQRGERADMDFNFPCVVKPCSGGSSVGASVVENREGLDFAIENALNYDDAVLIEQYIKGREFNVGVLDGAALPVIEIIPPAGAFYNYTAKYQLGAATEICPAQLPSGITERLQRCAEAVYRALRLEVYARMDFILSENGDIFCLEGNTLPGLTQTSLLPQEAAAAGISYDDLIEKIVNLSLEKYGDNL